ncbi:hypothetical protein [Nocardia araoensis]|uniref:hypothetical protein n=1 Tax=Nocardia araoensis TaxID=228600 RepID=UPI0002F088BE|nr:hypothetical protein [Nocardia araoensis]
MTKDTERDTTTTVSIYEVFTELDGYLASDDDYRYDVDTGLQQLQRTIGQLTTAETEQAQRSARLRDDGAAVGDRVAGASAANVVGLREIVAARMNDLIIGPLRIASAISPEVAIRMADGIRGQRWALSWLPGRVLTRQQAFSGMVLDEILTDPHELDSATMMLVMAELAAELSMSLEQALLRLSYIKKDDHYPRYRWSRCAPPPGHRGIDTELPRMRKAE